MDSEFEDLTYQNKTDELEDLEFTKSVMDYVLRSMSISFSFVGLLANFAIIYMIARNVRMRTKTNIILLNFFINDALFILTNLHFLLDLMELVDARNHISPYYHCLFDFIDESFQLNQLVLLLILISNTLMKSKRIQVKWLVIGIYTFAVCIFILQLVHCSYHIFYVFYAMCFIFFWIIVCLMVIKEFNNCFKKWYKKDPLSPRTLFRLNIGRIYVGSWISTIILYYFQGFSMHHFTYVLAQHCFMTPMYILIYILYADKNFRICFLNMLKCKGAGDYDVNATITFAEEDSSDDNPGNNQVNINFNASESPVRTQVHEIG